MYDKGAMNDSYLPPEAKAYKAFLEWIDQGKLVLRLFDQYGIDVPPTLRAVTEGWNGNQSGPRPITLRAPDKPEVPPKAKADWIWIDAREAMVRSVFLAVLNEGVPLPIKAIVERVHRILPKANRGSIYNNVAHLRDRVIHKVGKNWSLMPNVPAPVLHKRHIWAPKEVLHEQEQAAFRRMAVRHALTVNPDGLQLMQIVRQLERVDWLHVPLSKDLIKADLVALEKDRKVRMGSSKKWALVKEENNLK